MNENKNMSTSVWVGGCFSVSFTEAVTQATLELINRVGQEMKKAKYGNFLKKFKMGILQNVSK